MNIAFRWAKDKHEAGDAEMTILDLKDLRSVIDEMGRKTSTLRSKYGHVAPATVGVIQRRLLVLEEQGAAKFFGEPALDIIDFLKVAPDGRGVVNVLAAEKLMNTPHLPATFLLWLLTELFEKLPEVGDLDKPKLVFFFDEAHLLFNEAPKAVLEQVQHVTRLIRSRYQHLLCASARRRTGPRFGAARRSNSARAARLHAERAESHPRRRPDVPPKSQYRHRQGEIQELKVGEALVSLLHGKGEPSMVERTLIRPPLRASGRSPLMNGRR